ncbi:MAG: thymidylate synthase [Candidatus Nomurabacteria bacterium]|jgi:thymidylate synthase|nr:thymidylate synthase [Candidatus Nomurabacteria bacterium]
MTKFDEQYLDLCERILQQGEMVQNNPAVASMKLKDNAGTNFPNHLAQTINPITTYRLPHQVLKFDLAEEFPILTSKHVAFKTSVLEMLWIYQVQSNEVGWLRDRGIKIWDEWEIAKDGTYLGKKFGKKYAGTIGTAYGWIVNRYQLTQGLIETLKNDRNNRRMIMSLWQNEWLPTAALPSCVWNTQWNVVDGKLNLIVTVRSNDVPLGMPFNVSQYATLCYLLAHVCDLQPGQMTYVINDAHIYENQVGGIWRQLRLAREQTLPPAPKLWINPEVKDFFAFDNSKDLKDIKLENYQNLGRISMPVAM